MTQDVDPQTFYDVGKGLYEKAGTVYSAFNTSVATLGTTGSMAGSTDDGKAWAQSYDSRAADVLGAVNDLTKALENYGGVIIQAGYNHAMAEYNANPSQKGTPPVRPADPASVAGELTAPPSAGGPGTGLIENIGVLEHIGIPVPDGDTDKLDKASTAWNQLATGPGITAVVQALSGNAAKFRDTKSPEVEYIVKDLDELHQAADAILGSCAELAQSCSEYKTSLDDLRTKMKETVEDLVEELAISAVIGIATAFLSAGVGAFAATAKAAASIKKYAGIIRGIIESWKISKNIKSGVKKVHDVAGVRKRLERIKNLGKKGKGEEPKPPPPTPALPPGVKPGWPARPANNGKGTIYQKPGSPGDSNSVRVMEPGADPRYPNGYVKFTNEHNQPITLDGKPGSRAETHIPRNPDGTYPIPKGW
ncbi:hypothetical protein [Mycolicibacterium llatzerense]|uniref:WXG100-like domain-containing protein n=1 Tax=Mycolicibacterium llatzerense TaxID=280871 RepID=UPI0008DE65B6|nr:hypothetical protein [Mycolicibacterium llatzerense]